MSPYPLNSPILLPRMNVSGSIDDFFNGFLPKPGHDLQSEIRCYSLPYGIMGFVSHFLTYYTLLCLWKNRSPLMPWRKLRFSKWERWLGIVALIVTMSLAVLTLVRCRSSWQLLTIGVWKLSMSLLNGITAVNVANIVMKHHEGREGRARWTPETREEFRPMLSAQASNGSLKVSATAQAPKDPDEPNTSGTIIWILLYVPGMFAGMAGLMDLVKPRLDTDKRLVILTAVFYAIVGIGVGIAVIFTILFMVGGGDRKDSFGSFLFGIGVSFVIFVILAAFYSDFALGMITKNLMGLPSKDNAAFYWTYFVSKRLTMFSW